MAKGEEVKGGDARDDRSCPGVWRAGKDKSFGTWQANIDPCVK